LRWGGTRPPGGGGERCGPNPATPCGRHYRFAGRLPPLTTVGVVQQPQALRQRWAHGDGRPGPRRPRRRRCCRKGHSPRRGVSRRRARQGCDGRDLGVVGARPHRGRGGRSPAGAIGGRRRGRLLLSRKGCSTTGARRWRWRGRRSTRGAAVPRRSGSGGAGTASPPVSAGASPRRGAPGPDAPRGVRVAVAVGRGRRQPTGRHAAVAARCARNGHSPSSVMIASGNFVCMEGIICIDG